jgi:hypothetical protein
VIQRRSIIAAAGTVVGGALSGLASTAEAAPLGTQATQESDRLRLQEVAGAVASMRDEIARQYTFWEIAAVRDQMRAFLRANGKFPDFIETGPDIWQQVYDWYVRFQQPITLGRTPEGRYTIFLIATNVVMRPDMAAGFVGLPYDNR